MMSMRRWLKPVLLASAVVVILSANSQLPAHSQTPVIVVDSTIDAIDARLGDGVCASAAGDCTLRAALMEANVRQGTDTIELPAGTYRLSLSGSDEDAALSGDLDIRDELTLVGPDGRDRTIIESVVDDRVLHLPCASEVEVRGLTIRGGRLVSQGGGILSTGKLTILDSAIEANSASIPRPDQEPYGNGGGIYNDRGEIVVRNTLIKGNESGYEGGGIANLEGSVHLFGVEMSDNRARYGGGAIESGGWGGDGLLIVDSQFVRNTAGYEGGGISIGSWDASALVMLRSTLATNEAGHEGGGLSIGSRGSTAVTMTNSTISGNRVGYEGGGLSIGSWGSTTMTMTNSTISGNHAEYGGGGMQVGGWGETEVALRNMTVYQNTSPRGASLGFGSRGTSLVTLADSIMAGGAQGPNCGQAPAGRIRSLGFNLSSDGSCQLGATGDQVGLDARLMALNDNGGATHTHALLAGSPALDAADPVRCLGTDQRGAPRPVGAGCDMGAVEHASTPPDVSPTVSFSEAPRPAKHERWFAPRPCGGSPVVPGTAVPPIPTAAPPAAACVCRIVSADVPRALIVDALSNPASVYGWGLPVDPGKPVSRFNPLRECLSYLNPALGFDPVWNPLRYRAGCP